MQIGTKKWSLIRPKCRRDGDNKLYSKIQPRIPLLPEDSADELTEKLNKVWRMTNSHLDKVWILGQILNQTNVLMILHRVNNVHNYQDQDGGL